MRTGSARRVRFCPVRYIRPDVGQPAVTETGLPFRDQPNRDRLHVMAEFDRSRGTRPPICERDRLAAHPLRTGWRALRRNRRGVCPIARRNAREKLEEEAKPIDRAIDPMLSVVSRSR